MDIDGTPWTTAVVDGAWCQRSYGHRYSAKSGCAVIIGHHTKKLLFLGMRNVYCATCSRAANKGEEPSAHKCFRNWTGPSTQMESDIIVEGFKYCERVFGLRFKKFIGDGDSSVHKAIVDSMPHGISVQKIECANHVVKNLTKALYALAKGAQNSKFLNSRRNGIISRCARGAISRAAGNVAQLKTDLKNVPSHVFGDHERCPSDVCRLAGKGGENLLPQLPVGLHRGIMQAVDRVVVKADSLAMNFTSNLAESIMSLVAKFIGGKQFNRSQSGSYNRRCQGAALSYQLGAGWHYPVWKKISNKSPGIVMKKFVAQKVKQRGRSVCRKQLQFGESRKVKRLNLSKPQGDEHYGPHALQPDLALEQFKARCEDVMREVAVSEEARSNIEKETRGQSETHLWWMERQKRLTASHFGSVCKRRSTTSCAGKVRSILYHVAVDNPATQHGKAWESVAMTKYEEETGVKVQPCGLFIHPEYCFLAASPDGLVGDDGVLEIKCPYTIRDLDPKEGVTSLPKGNAFCTLDEGHLRLNRSHNYFYQVQGQMQVTGRRWCDFVVCTYHGILIERIERDDLFWDSKMFPQLDRFYRYCILPEIADPRHTRKMPIRDPDYVLEAQAYQKGAASGRKRKLGDVHLNE